MITISTSHLRAVQAAVADPKSARNEIKNVFLDPDGWAIGSNGHIMIKAPLMGDLTDIPKDGYYFAPIKLSGKGPVVSLNLETDRASISSDSSTQEHLLRPSLPVAPFPDWRRVLPSDTRPHGRIGAIAVDMTLLVPVVKALNAVGMRMFFGGSDSDSILLCFAGNDNADVRGVLMPMRW